MWKLGLSLPGCENQLCQVPSLKSSLALAKALFLESWVFT